jgi:hypothetical protein
MSNEEKNIPADGGIPLDIQNRQASKLTKELLQGKHSSGKKPPFPDSRQEPLEGGIKPSVR